MPGEKLPTYLDYVPDDEGREQLDSKLNFHVHTTAEFLVPSRVKPKVVEDFLKDELKPNMKPDPARHAVEITRFYRVKPAVEKFVALLNKRESKPEEFIRSLNAMRVIGELGTAEQQAAAAKYFDYILRQNAIDEIAEDAVYCYFHLDPSVTDKQVAEALTKRGEALKAAGDERKAAKLEEHAENTLPLVTQSKNHRIKLLAEKDKAVRCAGLAGLYIGTEDVGGFEWYKWGAYNLMGELDRSTDKDIVTGLRTALGKVRGGDADSQQRSKAAATRAIAFFAGELTPEETELLARDKVQKLQLEG